jgi:hypothetical protein
MNVSSTSSVLGHDLAGVEELALAGFLRSFVSGHDFSRAENGPYKLWALAPEEPLLTTPGR